MKRKFFLKALILLAGAALAAQLCACSVPAGNVISGQGSLSYPEESEASLSEAEQSLIPHPAQLARKRAAVEDQIIRQLLP